MKYYKQDWAGNTPEEGDYVAYNWSGQIACGVIAHITPKGDYKIVRSIPEPKDGENWLSIIRGGAKCLLVLRKGGTP